MRPYAKRPRSAVQLERGFLHVGHVAHSASHAGHTLSPSGEAWERKAHMKVRLIEEEGRLGIEVDVRSAPGDQRAARIAERLCALDARLAVYEPGSIRRLLLPFDQVLFLESEGDHTKVHVRGSSACESGLRLGELEEALEGTEFVRVSRQVIVNFDRVASIRPELYGRLALGLEDGSELLVTRTYAADIKGRLGIAR